MSVRQIANTVEGIRDDHVNRYRYAGEQIKILMAGETIRHAHVMDIGCGVGYGSHIMAQCGHQVHGYDIDVGAIAHANQHFTSAGARFACADLKDIACRDYFDAVTMFEVVEHTPAALSFLDYASHSIKYLLASVPNEAVVPFDSPNTHPDHYRHFTAEQFTQALSDAGWQVVCLAGQHGKKGDAAAVTKTGSETWRTLVATCISTRRKP